MAARLSLSVAAAFFSMVALGCDAESLPAPGLIVFSARPDAADASGWQLFVVNADGQGLRRLARNDGDTNPVWSTDGTQVAF